LREICSEPSVTCHIQHINNWWVCWTIPTSSKCNNLSNRWCRLIMSYTERWSVPFQGKIIKLNFLLVIFIVHKMKNISQLFSVSASILDGERTAHIGYLTLHIQSSWLNVRRWREIHPIEKPSFFLGQLCVAFVCQSFNNFLDSQLVLSKMNR
jgi:hypothetical protein